MMEVGDNADADSGEADVGENDIQTASEILKKGLEMKGWSGRKIERAGHATNTDRFVSAYGCSNIIVAQMWEDVQHANILDVGVDGIDIGDFLLALNVLNSSA